MIDIYNSIYNGLSSRHKMGIGSTIFKVLSSKHMIDIYSTIYKGCHLGI